MAFSKLMLTTGGMTLYAKAQQGKTLHFTRVALGDGPIGSGSLVNRSALISEKMSLLIDAIQLINDSTNAAVLATLSNVGLSEGFTAREIGLFAEDPDTHQETLYLYANAGTDGEPIPDGNSGELVYERLKFIITLDNTGSVTFEVSGNPLYLVPDDVAPIVQASLSGATAKATLADNDTLPLSDSEDGLKQKKISFANLKAALKTYFDTLYNKYVHPTTSGNKHIPAGGAANQILRWNADGTATWGADNDTITEVVDNLTSTDPTKALSAKQGKTLNDSISTVSEKVDNLDTTKIKLPTDTATLYGLSGADAILDKALDKVLIYQGATEAFQAFAANVNANSLDAAFGKGRVDGEVFGLGLALAWYAWYKSDSRITYPFTVLLGKNTFSDCCSNLNSLMEIKNNANLVTLVNSSTYAKNIYDTWITTFKPKIIAISAEIDPNTINTMADLFTPSNLDKVCKNSSAFTLLVSADDDLGTLIGTKANFMIAYNNSAVTDSILRGIYSRIYSKGNALGVVTSNYGQSPRTAAKKAWFCSLDMSYGSTYSVGNYVIAPATITGTWTAVVSLPGFVSSINAVDTYKSTNYLTPYYIVLE